MYFVHWKNLTVDHVGMKEKLKRQQNGDNLPKAFLVVQVTLNLEDHYDPRAATIVIHDDI